MSMLINTINGSGQTAAAELRMRTQRFLLKGHEL